MYLQGQLMQRSMVKSFELSLSYLSSLGRLNHAAQLVHTRSTPANLLQVRKKDCNTLSCILYAIGVISLCLDFTKY